MSVGDVCKNVHIKLCTLSLPPCAHVLPPIVVWTWHQWLGYGAHGRNYPASMRSCSVICRMSSTHPGTWPSTATSWAARACSHPSSHCFQWSKRISPSYMKVGSSSESPECLAPLPLIVYQCKAEANYSAQFDDAYFLRVEENVNFSLA